MNAKTKLLEFIHNAAAESTKTPPLLETNSVKKMLEEYRNINKELYLSSILKEI